MKTTLVYPYKKKMFTGCNPPVSLLYLAAALQRAGQDVSVIDIDEDDRSYAEVLEHIKSESPDLVGVPLYTLALDEGYNFVQFMAKESHPWKLLLGGPHVSVSTDAVMKEFESCDFILRGEAENSIVELTEFLEKGKDLSHVKGLTFRKNGSVINNPEINKQIELNELAFPARDLLKSAYEKNTYWRLGHRGTTDFIITSRGCPYNCNFCFRLARKFRKRSPENIVAELKELKSRGIENVHIMDDLFVWNKPHFFEVVNLIKKEKLNMKFKVRARVNFIDEEMLRAMKEIGVKSVVYGIESGSQIILDAMNKKTTVEMNYRAIRITKQAGLECYGDLFLGYPGETLETIKETERLLLKAKPTAINLSVMYPIPGTHVYDEAKKQGTLRDDWDIHGRKAWIKLPWIESTDELNAIRKRVVKKYLRNPIVFFNGIRATFCKLDWRQFKVLMFYVLKQKEF
ncbi:radical SAM protein [candidate division KSB1 bacterium]|nr:radical SAM protein [candidate division KSB1 bacterium]